MVALSSKANLFFLSPGGIHLGKGAGFINVPKLSLSTADQLRFAEGTFDVFHSTPESVAAFTTNPLPGVFGMRRSEMDKESCWRPGSCLGFISMESTSAWMRSCWWMLPGASECC